jgi:hypothetical protein
MLALLILFIVGGVVGAVAQQRYFDAIVATGGDVMEHPEFAQRVLDRPARVFQLVASELRVRLRALLTRQADPRLERMRLVALASIGVSLLTFVAFAVAAYRS